MNKNGDGSVFERRINREKKARQHAEELLEVKSLELFLANKELRDLADKASQQAEQTRLIVDNVGEGIITYDQEGRILSFNIAAEKIFGCDADSAMQENVAGFVPALDIMRSVEADVSAFAVMLPFEQVGHRSDGVEIPLEVTVSTSSFNGAPIHTALIRDRTSRRLLEKKLAHAQKMESIGRLAAGIAHEINTPMQFLSDNTEFFNNAFSDIENILSLCESIANEESSESNKGERIKQELSSAKLNFLRSEIPVATKQSLEGVERISRIIQALREYSHPGNQNKTYADLNQVVENSIAISRSQWKYVAKIETDLAADLPKIECYVDEVNQVMLNLITNAAQAIEEVEDREGVIKIASATCDGFAVIRVSDNGTGMSDEIRSKIFDPFFTTKEVGKGSGQGLAICYAMMEKHGGRIECQSDIDLGTTFSIYLPISQIPNKS